MEQKKKRENLVAGSVGAFLGTLAGVVCTVVIGQMGYVASISGLIMAVCALKGYELLGGTLSKKGAAISSLLILVMTYFAHRLTWAFTVANATGLGILASFRAIPHLLDANMLEGPAYWGNLVMLYLFPLLGAVPTIIGGLRAASMPDLPAGSAPAVSLGQTETEEAVFYPADKTWMRPLRRSAQLSMLPGLLAGIALLAASVGRGAPIFLTMASLGCLASAFLMMCLALPPVRVSRGDSFVFVRAAGLLWRVNLSGLNTVDTYRFTKKSGNLRALRWDILTPEEQAQAKISIMRAVSLLSGGQVMAGSVLSLMVLPLTDLCLTQETPWSWKCSYALRGNKRKKIVIAKAYPGLAPLRETEIPEGPVPCRWSLCALALVLAVLLGAAGGGLGHMVDRALSGGWEPPSGQTEPSSQQPEPPSAQSKAPDGALPVEITADNYQSLFHLAEELGYEQVAAGYIKAPSGMFGHDAFVDAHVPYSPNPLYLDGGSTLCAAAHGMEVRVTINGPAESAKAVVDEAYGSLADAGADIYEDGVSETTHFEDYDIAIKQVIYLEDNGTKPRIAILYADRKQNGYYLSAQITYLPEQMDDDYPQLLSELSSAYALTLPDIQPFAAA